MGQRAVSASLTLPKNDKPARRQAFESIDEDESAALGAQQMKFAAITAAVSDVLLDDETSPSDSLISSTTSDDMSDLKQAKKKINDSIKGINEAQKEIGDVSLRFDVLSPISHGSPNHASNSFSLSDGDGGRDFLIDDEIADQPVLCIGDEARGESGVRVQSETALTLLLRFQLPTVNCTRSATRRRSRTSNSRPGPRRTSSTARTTTTTRTRRSRCRGCRCSRGQSRWTRCRRASRFAPTT